MSKTFHKFVELVQICDLKNIQHKTINIMNTKLISLGGGSYVTPEIKSLEIKSEGVLCQSGKLLINPFEVDEEELNC